MYFSIPEVSIFPSNLQMHTCNHACPTKKSRFQFIISFFVGKVTYSVALQRKEVAISSWIPLSGREHKILESVTMNNEKHRIHKQNSPNKSSHLSKTLKHFYRRRRELYNLLENRVYSLGRKKEGEKSIVFSHSRRILECARIHISSTINIPRDHYAASTLIRVLFANLSTCV